MEYGARCSVGFLWILPCQSYGDGLQLTRCNVWCTSRETVHRMRFFSKLVPTYLRSLQPIEKVRDNVPTIESLRRSGFQSDAWNLRANAWSIKENSFSGNIRQLGIAVVTRFKNAPQRSWGLVLILSECAKLSERDQTLVASCRWTYNPKHGSSWVSIWWSLYVADSAWFSDTCVAMHLGSPAVQWESTAAQLETWLADNALMPNIPIRGKLDKAARCNCKQVV